jgi:hypothetical protein
MEEQWHIQMQDDGQAKNREVHRGGTQDFLQLTDEGEYLSEPTE